MNDGTTSVACPGCGKVYVWKAEYAGRQLKCKCGEAVRGPTGKAVMVGSGYVVGHRARPQVAEEGEESVLRAWVLPLGLLTAGLLGRALELTVMRRSGGPSLGVALAFGAGGIVLATAALVVGVLGAVQVMGSEMDGPMAMVRKAAGIAVFATAMAVLLASFDKDPLQMRGAVVAIYGVVLIYFVGLCFLMKMDLLEALLASVITLLVQAALFLAVAQAVPAATGKLMFYGG